MRTIDMTKDVPVRINGRLVGERKGFLDRVVDGLREGVLSYLGAIGAVNFATYNYKGGYRGGSNTGMPWSPKVFSIAEIKLDFAAIATDRTAAGAAALASADVLQLFEVPAGTWVLAAAAQVTTAEGAAAVADFGDGTDIDLFIAQGTLDLNVVGWSSSLITTAGSLATAGGKIYTASDTLDLVLGSNSIDVAVVHIYVAMIDLRAGR